MLPTSADDLATSDAHREKWAAQAVIFVHGFNNTFAEGVYRIAQLSHDLDLPRRDGALLLAVGGQGRWAMCMTAIRRFTPATGSRTLLTRSSKPVLNEVIVVAHSMGALLLVEALRQMDIRDPRQLRSHLKGVVLLSPDIDVEVFRSQARRPSATCRNLS